MTVEIFRLSFSVFACAFPMEISSIFGKSFPFPFPYFVTYISVRADDLLLRLFLGDHYFEKSSQFI